MVKISIKFADQTDSSAHWYDENIKISKLNEDLKLKCNYNGSLYLGNTKLPDSNTLLQYINIQIYEFDFKPNGSSITMLVIPNGWWINGLERKKLTFMDSDDLKKVSETVLKTFKQHETSWLQLYNSRIPLLFNESSNCFTLKQLNIKSNDELFVDFFPNAIPEDAKYNIIEASNVFRVDESYWKAPEQQSELSLSCFLSSLKALHLFFTEFLYASHFFKALNEICPFPPAVCSFYRLYRSNAMKIDQLVVIRFLFYWKLYIDDKVLKQDENKDAFSDFNLWLFVVLKSINYLDDPSDVFIEINLKNKTNNYIKDPILLDGQLQDISDLNGESAQLSAHAYDFKALIETIKHEGVVSFLIHSTVSPKANLLIKNVDGKLENFTAQLVISHWFRFLAYTSKETLSEFTVYNSLSLFNGKTVVVESKLKGKKNDAYYNVFDPYSKTNKQILVNKFESKLVLLSKNLPVLPEGVDTRPIEQIDVVIFDYSGSMSETIQIETENNNSFVKKFDAAVSVGCGFVDKLDSYDLSHAVGMIKFNDKVEVISEITRNFKKIPEKIIMKDPNGGTNLWVAIEEAVNMIKKYRSQYEGQNTEHRLKTYPYISRIFCLTDGDDTSGKEADQIANILKKENIVFDCIVICNISENIHFQRMQSLAYSTKSGYFVWSGDGLKQITKIINSEAFLSVQQRVDTSDDQSFADLLAIAKTNKLVTRQIKLKSMPMDGKAVKRQSTTTTNKELDDKLSKMMRPKRIKHEFKKCSELDPKETGFQFYMDEANLDFWRLIYSPPHEGNPYYRHDEQEKKYWLLSIRFPVEYPEKPPEIRFMTSFFHPNINTDGRICHEILTRNYFPSVSIANILLEINSMIYNPNAEDPLDENAADLYKDSEEKRRQNIPVNNHDYRKKVLECLNNAWSLIEIKKKHDLID